MSVTFVQQFASSMEEWLDHALRLLSADVADRFQKICDRGRSPRFFIAWFGLFTACQTAGYCW